MRRRWQWLNTMQSIYKYFLPFLVKKSDFTYLLIFTLTQIWCADCKAVSKSCQVHLFLFTSSESRREKKIHKKVYPCKTVCSSLLESISRSYNFFCLLYKHSCWFYLHEYFFVLSSWDGLYFFDSHLCFYIIWMDETLNLVININVNEKVENRWIVPLIYGFFVIFFSSSLYLSTEN